MRGVILFVSSLHFNRSSIHRNPFPFPLSTSFNSAVLLIKRGMGCAQSEIASENVKKVEENSPQLVTTTSLLPKLEELPETRASTPIPPLTALQRETSLRGRPSLPTAVVSGNAGAGNNSSPAGSPCSKSAVCGSPFTADNEEEECGGQQQDGSGKNSPNTVDL